MLHINPRHALLFFLGAVLAGLLLNFFDASWTVRQIATGVMAALVVPLLFRHRDESVDPPLDVLAWRVGFRGRKLPQLLAAIDSDKRR